MKVFWSWQSDYSPKTCRHFIKSALDKAVELLAEDLGLEEADRPSLDHDTKGTPGMVDIAQTILTKISESAAFVADLTPIARTEAGKAVPNPNVLIELGWAMKTPGFDNIVVILNEASGFTIEDLPFDIRHRRILSYRVDNNATAGQQDSAKRGLVDSLRYALGQNLQHQLTVRPAGEELVGVGANLLDESTWLTSDTLEIKGRSIGKVKIRESAPRAYMRIIPGPWKDQPPSISTIKKLPSSLQLTVPTSGGNLGGDEGATVHGYVKYLISKGDQAGNYEAQNAIAYFDKTGEFWLIDGGVFFDDGKGITAFHCQTLCRDWSVVLRHTMILLNHLGANKERRVEAGVTSMSHVVWAGKWQRDRHESRKESAIWSHQSSAWDNEGQLKFLTMAINKVLDLFAYDELSADDMVLTLRDADSGRFV